MLVFGTVFLKKLSIQDKQFILENCSFYSNLKPKYQKYFEHRIIKFASKYKFVGENIEVTTQMKLLIATSFVKLTFGYREYLSSVFETIVIYPDIYESETPKRFHKGEFNPKKKIIKFSWKHFNEGNSITNDNLNLGLHEFAHVLHYQSNKIETPQTLLFRESTKSLFAILKNEELKQKLISSGYLRGYAFENQYEFVAVVLEHFFETPTELKSEFPQIYCKVKQMINYNEKVFIV